MLALESGIYKLLRGEVMTLDYQRFNDGTRQKPEIWITETLARIETHRWNGNENPDLVIYLTGGDDKEVGWTEEVYRMPLPNNLNDLTKLLELAREQAHT